MYRHVPKFDIDQSDIHQQKDHVQTCHARCTSDGSQTLENPPTLTCTCPNFRPFHSGIQQELITLLVP